MGLDSDCFRSPWILLWGPERAPIFNHVVLVISLKTTKNSIFYEAQLECFGGLSEMPLRAYIHAVWTGNTTCTVHVKLGRAAARVPCFVWFQLHLD